MARHARQGPPDSPPLDKAILPAREALNALQTRAELDITALRRASLSYIQAALDSAAGRSFGSYAEQKEFADRVAILLEGIGAVLLFTGDVEARGKTRSYVRQPVKVRCETPGCRSFKVRESNRTASHVTSSTSWPALTAALREDVTTMTPTAGPSLPSFDGWDSALL